MVISMTVIRVIIDNKAVSVKIPGVKTDIIYQRNISKIYSKINY